MDHILNNGAVLPSGLLSDNDAATMAGFNKSYKNFPLRVGAVVASYPISSDFNRSKLTTEYDVMVIEQNEDRGATTILYRNCMSSEGMGSIADYFEKALRPKKKKTTRGDSINLKGQDGAIVLLLCLDAMSDKGIIISQLTHPDRATNLVDEGPYLEGEYNGANIQINTDGSCVFTFKGATDNQGNPTDPSQGNTIARVEKDGSFQISHKTITFRMDKSGALTATATGDVNINCANATVTASGTATVEGTTVKLGAGASEAVIKGNVFKSLFDKHTHPTALGPSGPPTLPLDASALSKKVETE